MVLGIGIDIVSVPRVARLMERHSERVSGRVFTEAELAVCLPRANSDACLAARFAAKEAVIKALGAGQGVYFRDIEVVGNERQPPRIALHAGAAKIANDLGVGRIHLSLSHEREFAVAVVVIEGCEDAPAR